MSEKLYWLAFSAVPGMGPAKFKKFLEKYGSAKSAWEALENEAPRPGLAEFSIERYLKQLKAKDVWFVSLLDEDYPQLLREIKNPPFVLYGKGSRELLTQACSTHSLNVFSEPGGNTQAFLQKDRLNSADKFEDHNAKKSVKSAFREESRLPFVSNSTIAVVGARRTTQYGREVTRLLTTDLVLAGFTIVSGLALGVDAISHMTALENNGKTIAVLGCGVDCCSPGENQSIYDDIINSGNCIVSEFPLGMEPTLWSFPARNRIIAGLSEAVLVTEGAEDSGSLITAKFALKFNRKVFAVPGPITSSMSKGPYQLISKGAKLVTSGEDILNELKIQKSKVKSASQNSKVLDATKEEQIILDLLKTEPLHFDEIVRRTKFNSSQLSSFLSMMEIRGLLKNSDSKFSLI